ncbi:MAG TPA: hypothetical protein DCM67_05015 [Propionibacteriaceae bacterium]|nr:hypothetical protein [Propionibacteriaceae bacterium]
MAHGRRPTQLNNAITRLVERGQVEPLLAALLAGLAVTLDLALAKPWQGAAIDILACTAAAFTPRWPRIAGTVLGLVVASYIFIPETWATLGEYALIIPIIGTGMSGRSRTRAVMSVAYFLVLAANIWHDTPPDVSPIPGVIAWAVIIAAFWFIGSAFAAMIEASHAAQRAELLRQRQALARGIHDTVARSLTRVTMAAERSRLRGMATEADVATISEAAARSAEELRWLMALLEEDTETLTLTTNDPLDRTLNEARQDLERHDFAVTLSVTGSLSALTSEQSELLGSVTAEAVANIIKHGQSDTACALIVDIGDDLAELVFVNQIRSGAPQQQTISLGLESVRQRLGQHGGEVHQESSPPQWITRVRLPIGTPVQTPGQVA